MPSTAWFSEQICWADAELKIKLHKHFTASSITAQTRQAAFSTKEKDANKVISNVSTAVKLIGQKKAS